MLPTRLARALLPTFVCLALLVPAVAAYDPDHIPDGHDWVFYSPEYKLRFVAGALTMAREEGAVTRYAPLFYYTQLNVYYSDWDRLDTNLGNALADIAEWADDLAMAKE